MKQFIILFIAFVMLAKPLWPIAEYVMNYDYISNVLCENKNRPQLNCDGKCYLAKQLAKESEEKGKNPFEQRQINVELVQLIYFQSLINFDLDDFFCFSSKKPIAYSETKFSSLHSSDLIQPPEAS